MTVPCSAIFMQVNCCYHKHKGWLSTVSIMEGTKQWKFINPDRDVPDIREPDIGYPGKSGIRYNLISGTSLNPDPNELS